MIFRICIAFFILSLFSCQSYMNRTVENITGLKIAENLSLCNGLPVVDKVECKPTGNGWRKENIHSLDLTSLIRSNNQEINLDSYSERVKILRIVYNHYILFIKDEISLNACHEVDIFTNDLYNPVDSSKKKFVDHSHNINNFAQVYSEEAINKAEAILVAGIQENNYKISIDTKFRAKFRSSLRENITKNLKSSGKLLYVILNFVNSGLPNDSSIISSAHFGRCQSQFNKGKEIIIGVAGIILAGFKNEGDVFSKVWFEKALESAIGEKPDLTDEINEIKTTLAIKWSSQVNTEIQTTMRLLSGADFFYPTWILTVKAPFWKTFFLN